MAQKRKEYWDLKNVGVAKFWCYRGTFAAAAAVAKARKCAILIRHHGPRPGLNDRTRVNHYVWPDGRKDYVKNKDGNLVDAK